MDFEEYYNSQEFIKFTDKCKDIKVKSAKNERNVAVIVFLSIISSAIVGYAAFGIFGAVIFALLVYLGATVMLFTVKKQSIINYINCYRTELPKLLGKYSGASKVTSEELDFQGTCLDNIFKADLYKNRMSNFYYFEDTILKIAYSKAYQGKEEVFGGLAYSFENKKNIPEKPIYIIKSDRNFSNLFLCDEPFEDIKVYSSTDCFDISSIYEFIKELNEKYEEFYIGIFDSVTLYLPAENNYLSGRPENKDDLELQAVKKQLDYLMLGITFYKSYSK